MALCFDTGKAFMVVYRRLGFQNGQICLIAASTSQLHGFQNALQGVF